LIEYLQPSHSIFEYLGFNFIKTHSINFSIHQKQKNYESTKMKIP
jgi:hypothetical protein